MAKTKISQYRKQSEQLQQEKEQVIRKKDAEIDQIRGKLDDVIKEKQRAVLNHKEDLE